MPRQFLINADGTLPPICTATFLAFLEAEGIPLVVPTPIWTPAEGYMLVEADPTQDANGVWHQTWIEVLVPPPPPPPEACWRFARDFTPDEMSQMRDLAVQSADMQAWADALLAGGYISQLT